MNTKDALRVARSAILSLSRHDLWPADVPPAEEVADALSTLADALPSAQTQADYEWERHMSCENWYTSTFAPLAAALGEGDA